jgi:hypothetical protein
MKLMAKFLVIRVPVVVDNDARDPSIRFIIG